MKRLAIIIAALLLSVGARAQFFAGVQFGLFTDGNATITDGDRQVGGTTFNYTIKPSVGYYFTPRLVGGVKLIFADCKFNANDTASKTANLEYTAMNLLMGNGLDNNHLAWKVSPYLRYKAFSLFNDKFGIWAELNGYVGETFPREDGKLDKEGKKTTYGFLVHPLISYDITDKYMVFTSFDMLSLGWDGSTNRYTMIDGTKIVNSSGSFLFQCNPIIGIAKCFFNIGIQKKF